MQADRAIRGGARWGTGGKAACIGGVGLLLALGGCEGPCDLGETARKMAGPTPVDCGYARLEMDSTAVNDCTVAAAKGGAPFFARFERGLVGTLEGRGTADAPLVDGFGRSPDGHLWVVDMACRDRDCRTGTFVKRRCVNDFTLQPIDCLRGACRAPVACSLWNMDDFATCGVD